MATYLDLYTAASSSTSLDKQIVVALAVKANAITKLTTPTAAQKSFAIQALRSPNDYLSLIRNFIFAEYNTQLVSVITGATDAQVQTAVNSAVDVLLGA